MRQLSLLLIILYSQFGYSQNSEVDSLLDLVKSTPHQEIKVDLLNDIAYKTSLIDLDTSFQYASQALDLASKIGYDSGRARALNIKSNKFLHNKEHLQSITLNNEALSIAKDIEDHKNLCRIYNSIAVNYFNMGDQENAIKNLQLAADEAELNKDTTGFVYILTNIGYLHLQNNSLQLAEKYLLDAKRLSEKINTQSSKRIVTRHLGSLYAALDNYALATSYFEEGIQLSTDDNDLFNLAWNWALLGKYLSEKKEFKAAEKNLYEGLKLFEQRKDLENQLEVCAYLAEHYNRKRDYANAIKASLECLAEIRVEGNNKHKVNFLLQLSLAYEGKGDNDNAYKYFKKYKAQSDTLINKENALKVMELESKYQIEKKEVENQLLVEEKATQQAIITRRNIAICASVILLLLLSMIATLLWRNTKKEQVYSSTLESKVEARTLDLQNANEKLSQSNEELERFAYIASHDLKEPVRNIISFTELLEKEVGAVQNKKVDDFIKIIKENSTQMHSLIRDTLEFSKIQGREDLLEQVDINKTIASIELSISDTIRKRNAQIIINKPLPSVKTNRTKLFVVFKNLIENGIKYNESENPTITIDHKILGKDHVFSLDDNGIGIDSQYFDRIFEMYKRLQKKEGWEGSGLGLATCKKIVQQLGGIIWIESKVGEGSKFHFTVPIV